MSTATAQTPLPRPTELTRPFWDGCKQGELRVQQCGDCQKYTFIPAPVCVNCFSSNLVWVKSSGQGTVYSFTVVYRPQQPSFEVPYVVGIVEVDNGWYIPTNIVGIAPDQVKIGMPVKVRFDHRSDDIALPMFEPA